MTVNGQQVSGDVPVRTSLADYLRDTLRLTGTHLGCEHGVCGACNVFLDGVSVRSCLMLAVQADGASVTTIEGLSDDPVGGAVQRALARRGGLQCGFCTPGFVVTLVEECRKRTASPGAPGSIDEESLRILLSGNLCRCTGYAGIVKAGLDVLGPADSE
ncbi:MAG TPA: (2Fe-2S)-binding protein [Solirubrobacteraceae bacterium]|jgi:carbon-monoxide dehydrogenase small subunit